MNYEIMNMHGFPQMIALLWFFVYFVLYLYI